MIRIVHRVGSLGTLLGLSLGLGGCVVAQPVDDGYYGPPPVAYAPERPVVVSPPTVAVYPLQFVAQADDWPEQDERETHWFSLAAAAEAVDETELKELIRHFVVPRQPAAIADRAVSWTRRAAGERIPMLKWFQALLPSQGRFFEQFEDHAATLVAGADALARLLEGGPDMADHIRAIHDREHEAEHSTHQAQEDALDEQLPDDAPARGAEGHPDGDLARAVRRSRQQQVGDVRAGDQQHEGHRGEQHEERLPGIAHDGFLQRHHRHALLAVADRILRRQPRCNAGHLGLCL